MALVKQAIQPWVEMDENIAKLRKSFPDCLYFEDLVPKLRAAEAELNRGFKVPSNIMLFADIHIPSLKSDERRTTIRTIFAGLYLLFRGPGPLMIRNADGKALLKRYLNEDYDFLTKLVDSSYPSKRDKLGAKYPSSQSVDLDVYALWGKKHEHRLLKEQADVLENTPPEEYPTLLSFELNLRRFEKILPPARNKVALVSLAGRLQKIPDILVLGKDRKVHVKRCEAIFVFHTRTAPQPKFTTKPGQPLPVEQVKEREESMEQVLIKRTISSIINTPAVNLPAAVPYKAAKLSIASTPRAQKPRDEPADSLDCDEDLDFFEIDYTRLDAILAASSPVPNFASRSVYDAPCGASNSSWDQRTLPSGVICYESLKGAQAVSASQLAESETRGVALSSASASPSAPVQRQMPVPAYELEAQRLVYSDQRVPLQPCYSDSFVDFMKDWCNNQLVGETAPLAHENTCSTPLPPRRETSGAAAGALAPIVRPGPVVRRESGTLRAAALSLGLGLGLGLTVPGDGAAGAGAGGTSSAE